MQQWFMILKVPLKDRSRRSQIWQWYTFVITALAKVYPGPLFLQLVACASALSRSLGLTKKGSIHTRDFKSLSADSNGCFPRHDPGAVLLMDAPSRNPHPHWHSCCHFCGAVTDGRVPYAEVSLSLLTGRFLLVGRRKCSPVHRHRISACVDWEIQSNVRRFRVMKQKINSMCFNY